MSFIDGHHIETLFTADQIAQRNREMAQQIAASQSDNLLVLPILKGSFVFAADLVRALHEAGCATAIEFITISSYGAGQTSETLTLLHDIDSNVEGQNILLIDDILESGKTLKFVRDLLAQRGAASIKIAALLDKSMRRQADIEADFVGFECPDKFVVGYGMDSGHKFRQLPFIGVITDE